MKTTICAAALALLLGTVCYGQKRMSQPAAASGASCQSVYNVRDFGAKGDGRSDDTKAIQSALDHAIDHGGGTVYFPNGRYRLATMQENYRVKAHLIVKPKKSPGKRDYVMIRLRGETCVVTPCSYANHTGEDRSEVWDGRYCSPTCWENLRPIRRPRPPAFWRPERDRTCTASTRP